MDLSQLTPKVKQKLKNAARRRMYYFKSLSPERQKYVVYAGKYTMALSRTFLVRNKAERNLELIKELFQKKFKLFSRMERSKKQKTLMDLAELVWLNEQEIMKAFNFEVNKNFFRFWEMPGCTCPHMDNQERWGLDHGFIHSGDCPIHGKHTWKR